MVSATSMSSRSLPTSRRGRLTPPLVVRLRVCKPFADVALTLAVSHLGRRCSVSNGARFERGKGMRVTEIVRGKRAITTDTALRLSKALGVDDRFWIHIQTDYDLEVERDLHANDLAKVTAPVASWTRQRAAPRRPRSQPTGRFRT